MDIIAIDLACIAVIAIDLACIAVILLLIGIELEGIKRALKKRNEIELKKLNLKDIEGP